MMLLGFAGLGFAFRGSKRKVSFAQAINRTAAGRDRLPSGGLFFCRDTLVYEQHIAQPPTHRQRIREFTNRIKTPPPHSAFYIGRDINCSPA
jgi:hypothetical protein